MTYLGFYTVLPFDKTNVTEPLCNLKGKYSISNDISILPSRLRTIDDVEYSCDKEYTRAYIKQQNFNKIYSTIITELNPAFWSIEIVKRKFANHVIPATAEYPFFGWRHKYYKGEVAHLKMILDSDVDMHFLNYEIQGLLARTQLRVSEMKYAFFNVLDNRQRNVVLIKRDIV